jgi:hypothetical protein
MTELGRPPPGSGWRCSVLSAGIALLPGRDFHDARKAGKTPSLMATRAGIYTQRRTRARYAAYSAPNLPAR